VKRPSAVDQPSDDDEEETRLQPPESPLEDEPSPASAVPESSGIVGLFGEGMVLMPESVPVEPSGVLASGAADAVMLTSMTTAAATKERALRMMLTSEKARSIADLQRCASPRLHKA